MTVGTGLYLLPTSVQTINATEYGLFQNLWATPTVHGNYNQKGMSKKSGDGLATQVKNFPTPTTRDYKGQSGAGRQERKGNPLDTLPNAVGGSLNPMWVEWLMGFPLGWTDLKPLATHKFHYVQLQHGKY
jgi:DNA (cytosine-5)-methyltransferase 1